MRKKLLTVILAVGLSVFAINGKADAAGTTPSTATVISNGQTVTDSFPTQTTSHYYKFTLAKSGRLTVNATAFDAGTSVKFYDVSGVEVGYNEYVGTNKTIVTTRDLVAGTYYIEMRGYGSKGKNNTYSFTPVFTEGAESFPETQAKKDDTDATANAVNFGTTYNGYLGVNDLIDTYKVTVGKDSVIRMSVSGGMSSLNFEFYDTKGNRVKFNCATAASGSATIAENFRPFALKKGTYFLRVNTTSSRTGNYAFNMKRSDLGWGKDSKGWWYQYDDGTYAKSKQVKIGKKYYRFNAGGYMITGWKKVNREWYYYDKSSGAMVTGWKKIGKKWYYFQKDYGNMYTGYRSIGNKWYYFNTSGAMRTGWLKPSGSTWHYFGSDGAERYGWQKIGGKWYYFGKSGAMYHGGRYSINGRVYRFSDSGACLNP